MGIIKVQTGTKYDGGKVEHHATREDDGTITTACGAGMAKQVFYVLGEGQGAGYCVRCYKAAGDAIWAR